MVESRRCPKLGVLLDMWRDGYIGEILITRQGMSDIFAYRQTCSGHLCSDLRVLLCQSLYITMPFRCVLFGALLLLPAGYNVGYFVLISIVASGFHEL